MTASPVFTSRLTGRQLLDGEGMPVGRIRDVVILPTAGGAHLRGGTVDLRRFSRRTGEIFASDLYGRPAGAGTVLDVGIARSDRRRDGWKVILLNLAFSTQAAYAAPLILLAQNRQDDRDRASIERDREVTARTQADTEFLARELSAVRLALADVVTTQDLGDRLDRLEKLITDRQPPESLPTG